MATARLNPIVPLEFKYLDKNEYSKFLAENGDAHKLAQKLKRILVQVLDKHITGQNPPPGFCTTKNFRVEIKSKLRSSLPLDWAQILHGKEIDMSNLGFSDEAFVVWIRLEKKDYPWGDKIFYAYIVLAHIGQDKMAKLVQNRIAESIIKVMHLYLEDPGMLPSLHTLKNKVDVYLQ